MDAITEIGKATKQTSNEFTILHYISNGYLDVLIEYSSGWKGCVLQVSPSGYLDEYCVIGMEHEECKLYRVSMDLVQLNHLLSCFQNKKGMVKLTSGINHMGKVCNYVFLEKPFKCITNSETSKDLIELPEVLRSVNLGLELNVLDLLFDLQQIKNISSPIRKPITKGIVGHTKKARTIKDIGLWIARKEIKKNPSITKKGLGMNIQIQLKKMLNKLEKKKLELGIKGHITIPNEDTIRKWKELDKLFPKVK